MKIGGICLDFEWAIRLNRIILNIIGLWPSTPKNKFLSNVHATLIFIFLVSGGYIPLIHFLVRIWGDLTSMVDNLQYSTPFTMAIAKFALIWWKKTDLLIVINMIADDWMKAKTEEERCIMIKHARNARILTIAGYCVMIVAFAFLTIIPCFGKSLYISINLNSTKILPLPSHYIYDEYRSPYFELTYVLQSFILSLSFATFSGVDTLLGLLIFHLCGQLENLQEKLINIHHFSSYDKGVALVVKEHIRCFYIIENTYTLLLLGLLIYFGITFALYGFLIVGMIKDGETMSMLRFIYLLSILLNIAGHTCLVCAVGEILIDKCEGIQRATYEHKWYKVKPQDAKAMILILIRANKPLCITAGKMFPMTMSMFCNLLKTSASYVSVLLAMQN